MKITICGSIYFYKEMLKIKDKLLEMGIEVLLPVEVEDFDYHNHTHDQSASLKISDDLIRKHYYKIMDSDAILVVNLEKNGIENYIGGNTLIEIGYAFAAKREIFLLNPSPEISYKSEIDGMMPVILNGDLEKIKKYYDKLPKVFLASENELKKRAVSFGLRKFDNRFLVVGEKTISNVREQPLTLVETYNGALNRLENLKEKAKNYEFLVAIESGNVKFLDNFGRFDVNVCVIEDKKGERKFSIASSGVEIPDSLSDLIPKEYPDLGVLVQQKFGMKEKDPISYFTKGFVSRSKLIEQAFISAFSRF